MVHHPVETTMIKNNAGLGYQDVIPKFETPKPNLVDFFGYQDVSGTRPLSDHWKISPNSAVLQLQPFGWKCSTQLRVIALRPPAPYKAWSCQAYASMHCGFSDFCRASSQLVQLIETLLPPGLTEQMHPLMAAWQVAFGVHAWHCHFLVAQTHWNLSQSWWSRTKKCYSASYPTKPVAQRTVSAPWCAQNESMGCHTLALNILSGATESCQKLPLRLHRMDCNSTVY